MIDIITYIGIFVFSTVGTLKAMEHRFDIFGSTIIAFLSSYGGGTLRDLLIDRKIGWLNDNLALFLVLSGLIFTYLFKNKIYKYEKIIVILDAIGIGLFTILGINIALSYEMNYLYSIIFGVISATFGGLISDILCNRIPDLLKSGEIYATACLFGGFVYVLLNKFELFINFDILISVSLIVFIRLFTKLKNIKIPEF